MNSLRISIVAKPPYAAADRQCAEQVIAEDVLDCRWVKLACQRKFNYLARLRSKATPFRFNTKLTERDGRSCYPADTLCTFIDRLRDAKGPLADESIESSTQVDSKLFNFPMQLFATLEVQHAHFRSESNLGSHPPPTKRPPLRCFLVGGFHWYSLASTRGSITPCHWRSCTAMPTHRRA